MAFEKFLKSLTTENVAQKRELNLHLAFQQTRNKETRVAQSVRENHMGKKKKLIISHLGT